MASIFSVKLEVVICRILMGSEGWKFEITAAQSGRSSILYTVGLPGLGKGFMYIKYLAHNSCSITNKQYLPT